MRSSASHARRVVSALIKRSERTIARKETELPAIQSKIDELQNTTLIHAYLKCRSSKWCSCRAQRVQDLQFLQWEYKSAEKTLQDERRQLEQLKEALEKSRHAIPIPEVKLLDDYYSRGAYDVADKFLLVPYALLQQEHLVEVLRKSHTELLLAT